MIAAAVVTTVVCSKISRVILPNTKQIKTKTRPWLVGRSYAEEKTNKTVKPKEKYRKKKYEGSFLAPSPTIKIRPHTLHTNFYTWYTIFLTFVAS